MSGIEILSGNYCCRLWRMHSDPAHLLQPPGESERRQDFYLQKQPDLPGTEHLRPTLSNLVYVWDSSKAGVAIHLVCPYGFDGIWKPGDHLWQVAIEHPASRMKPTTDLAQRDDDDLPLYLDETGDQPEPGK
jgi:hypothetical protein